MHILALCSYMSLMYFVPLFEVLFQYVLILMDSLHQRHVTLTH